MCVLTFKNFDFPIVYHAFFELLCLEFGKSDILKMSPVSRSPRGGNSPELCDWWWPASGGSAPSEKTRPGILEHVSCGFCRCLSILGSPKWYRHRMTPMTTTATSQQGPCPTATGKQTRTGTKYPVQGKPPHSDIYVYMTCIPTYMHT
mgnify:CR=1 FL=1